VGPPAHVPAQHNSAVRIWPAHQPHPRRRDRCCYDRETPKNKGVQLFESKGQTPARKCFGCLASFGGCFSPMKQSRREGKRKKLYVGVIWIGDEPGKRLSL
jgi:hypothetical protein